MLLIELTEEFAGWLNKLKTLRHERRSLHGFGWRNSAIWATVNLSVKVSPKCACISDLGYRLYFTRTGEIVYLLLVGGDKSSQKRDIKRAIELARSLRKEMP